MRLLLIIMLVSISSVCYSQNQTVGKPYGEIFGDLHYNINDSTQNSGFAINRAHFGYVYLPAGNISATMIVDIGTAEDLAYGSKSRRYGYFREASITWANEKLEVTMGVTGTRIFALQQSFWGQRYLESPVLSIYGFGFVADLGLAVDYKINEIISADITVMNGEGYCSVQIDDNIKTSIGLTLTPGNRFVTRLYTDIQKKNKVVQNTWVGFIGYKSTGLTIGGEISFKSGIDGTTGHNGMTFSTTSLIGLSEKTKLFLRYDYSQSNVPEGTIERWNALNDRSFVITGIQYKVSDNVRLALNYRSARSYNNMRGDSDMIFLNSVFKF